MDGDFTGLIGSRDAEAIDSEGFADVVEDGRRSASREGDDGVGELDGLRGVKLGDVFVEQDAGKDRTGRKGRARLEQELG